MASPSRRRRQRSPQLRSLFRAWSLPEMQLPWLWLLGTAFLYAIAGLLMAAFPAPYWIWNLALGGIVLQALALAGPRALGRMRWWPSHCAAGAAILGTTAIVVALAIALNYVGTDNVDAISPSEVAAEVVKMSLFALVTAALGAIISAETGDRLLMGFTRLQTSLVLAATCILGLGLGGLIGVLAIPQ